MSTEKVDRMKRLETLLMQEFNTQLSRETYNQNLNGIITIVGVKISKDLKQARVFYSFMGDDNAREDAKQLLSEMKKEIGANLRKRVHLKRIPSFIFEFDNTPEKAAEVETVFAKLEREKKRREEK
ncbi:MAG: 30S ribosome-binding factor RbfA [Elusimicrobiaceae bacterium]|jgi:ribosome-binding factor A|nr:30S ribosome-binding factor RbfA [Elusimicrobiaceae bacterium]MBT3954600.1 30S ribosome-binding factor RbfA [Elusimicrobiaceae bacterium]MBT4007908.1 30S ribosome-binding factor RbfA [Elusimicrobiaceae bacterium]MBT4403119.1 30S ribosome-binding factor RbfA [Elusimicrobiaceae bacterium]MBT4439922.1 30S ribosome-binding factor RbfA [Elusimicrobiaceae bacterium]